MSLSIVTEALMAATKLLSRRFNLAMLVLIPPLHPTALELRSVSPQSPSKVKIANIFNNHEYSIINFWYFLDFFDREKISWS